MNYLRRSRIAVQHDPGAVGSRALPDAPAPNDAFLRRRQACKATWPGEPAYSRESQMLNIISPESPKCTGGHQATGRVSESRKEQKAPAPI